MKTNVLTSIAILLFATLTTFGQGCFLNGSSSNLGQTTKFSGNPNFDQINTQEYYYLVQKFEYLLIYTIYKMAILPMLTPPLKFQIPIYKTELSSSVFRLSNKSAYSLRRALAAIPDCDGA
jgi:hypothetical protein